MEARDEVYSHWTARRSVARAALHLGVERMTEEAIDTTASILMAYLDRLGSTLAKTVEASGRSSAHVHVLDALRAVEVCTTAAVQRVHMNESSGDASSSLLQQPQPNGEGNENGDPAVGDRAAAGGVDENGSAAGIRTGSSASQKPLPLDPATQMSWKGLAAFCFGRNWLHRQPTAMGATGGDAISLDAAARRAAGWDAPFPDEIRPFPRTAPDSRTANPHPFATSRGTDPLDLLLGTALESTPRPQASTKSNDNKSSKENGEGVMTAAAQQAYQMASQEEAPSTYQTWGNHLADNDSSTGKRKTTDTEADEAPPTAKRVKFSATESASEPTRLEEIRRSLQQGEVQKDMPSFYPPQPRSWQTETRQVLDTPSQPAIGALAQPTAAARQVRTSLVKLGQEGAAAPEGSTDGAAKLQLRKAPGQTPWGTVWESAGSLRVPQGLPPDSGSTGGAAGSSSSSATATAAPQPQIVPLGRASGSRVSRILEGSMDAATMQ